MKLKVQLWKDCFFIYIVINYILRKVAGHNAIDCWLNNFST